MDAILKFDPDLGYKFETYAITRIRGSIIDDLRSLDWVPRSVRFRERQIEQATERMMMILGREPTDEELADELELDLESILSSRTSSHVWHIDMSIESNDQTLADMIASETTMVGDETVSIDLKLLLTAIEELHPREKATVNLHYYLNFTLAEIGRRFGVTESRVCQIHTRALEGIRDKLLTGHQ
jgi:RNA polymerase sigma factor FliA